VVIGTKASFTGGPAATFNVAVALVSPSALTVMIAVPTVVGVKLDAAIPPLAVTGDPGLKDPVTPLTENVTAFVAVVMTLPFASSIVAVYGTAVPACELALAGVKASFAGTPAVTVKVAVALVSPAALTVIVAAPVVVGVKLDAATPALAATGDAGLNTPFTPLTANVIALVAVPTVLPFAS